MGKIMRQKCGLAPPPKGRQDDDSGKQKKSWVDRCPITRDTKPAMPDDLMAPFRAGKVDMSMMKDQWKVFGQGGKGGKGGKDGKDGQDKQGDDKAGGKNGDQPKGLRLGQRKQCENREMTVTVAAPMDADASDVTLLEVGNFEFDEAAGASHLKAVMAASAAIGLLTTLF